MSEALPMTDALRPGQVLVAARAEQNLSVADVSQQIKYGVNQIAAIEADDYAKLPGATFVRGMIRSYAKLVHLDPEPLLSGLNPRDIPASASVELNRGVQEPFIEGSRQSNRIYVTLSLLALLAVAAVVYEWQVSPIDTGEVVTITPRNASADAVEAASVSAVVSTVTETPAAPTPAAEPTAPAPPAQATMASPAETAPAAGSDTSGLKRIELIFDELSWVEIKHQGGKVLFSQLNQPGTSKVIEGVPPFDVVIGNAAKVRMKYDGAPVDLRPYFKIDVARLKLE